MLHRPAHPWSCVLLLAACKDDLGVAEGSTGPGEASSSGATTTEAPTSGGAGSMDGGGQTTTGGTATTSIDPSGPGETTTAGEATTAGETTGGASSCGCAADNRDILVLSDDGELWAYEPGIDAFKFVAAVVCPGAEDPYSMAVDRAGVAWIQYASDGNVYTFDPKHPGPCAFAGVLAKPAFEYMGLAFAPAGPFEACDRLFLLNYSGEGPFAEGPGIGALGVFDPLTQAVSYVGATDYDGGELAGTGEGRLFAFAGVGPAKLVEYDQATAQPLTVQPLTGLRKTNASAFAFHGGDAYFFTEAVETTCYPCLADRCPPQFSTCQADEACAEDLACSIALGDIMDACGGSMPGTLVDCMLEQCGAACYPATTDIFSKVTRLDHDESDGMGQALQVVNPQAPVRVVGAAASTCAPYVPQ